MDPLNAVAFLTSGCSQRCASPIVIHGGVIAYSSADAVYLYSPVVHKASVATSRRQSQLHGATPNQAHAAGASTEKKSTTYPLTRVFSNGVNGTIVSFHLNDDYVVCATSNGRGIVWRMVDGEMLSGKAVLESVSDFFRREGHPCSVLVSGKYHILFGTSRGCVVSANMNDGVTMHNVRLAADGATDRSESAVGRVCCMVTSSTRPDIIAVGTSGGFVCLLSLHPANGMKQNAVVKAFAMAAPAPPDKGNSFGSSASTVTGVSGGTHGGEGGKETHLPAVSAVAFDPSNPNCVVAGSREGCLAVIDAAAGAVVQVFDSHDVPVVSISFLLAEPGTFITADGESNKLRVWTLSSRAQSRFWTPVWALADDCEDSHSGSGRGGKSVNDNSISFSASFTAELVVFSMGDGRIAVCNTQQHNIEFETLPGHTDKLYACRYAHHSKDLVATAGADGSLRVWNTKQMVMQMSIYAGPVVVLGVDWSPTGKNIALALGNGHVVSYHVTTQKENWRVALTNAGAISCIVWSHSESGSYIVAGYAKGVSVLSARDGKEARRYQTNDDILSVDFNPQNSKNFAAACNDGQVFLFQTNMNREAPTVKLPGHTDAVTGVAFNGVVSHLLLSCSKDTTLRLWDLSNTTTPHTMSVDARVLRGHTGAVQAIAWCNAAPYLALSAAADCTLRLWDVRSSACLFAVRAVGSGAVALSAHPQRPFIFAAGGSDGSVTFWHVGLLRQLSLESALGTIERYVTSDHAALMADPSLTQGTTAVASAESMQHLCKELQVANITAQKRMELIMDYFEFPCGAADVSRAAAFISNPGDVSNADCLVIPPAQLVDVYAARAKSFVEKAHNKSVAAAGEAYKSKRLMEAAERMLQLGKVQEYCDLMMEAGEFDAAIGTAPLISRDFWRSVCLKAAAVMKEKGDKRAVRYFIMAEESVLAARCLAAQSDKNWDAATVVLRTCPQRAEDQKSAETPHGTVVDTNGTSPAAAEVADAREALLKHSSNLRLIVASMLNGGANDAAAMQLVRSGDVLLAHLLIHTVPLQHRTTIDAGYRLSMLQSCSQQYWDTALVCATRQSNVYDAMATVLALYQQALIRPKAFNANKTDTRSQCDANAVQVAEKLKAFQEQILAECRRLQLPLDIASIQQKHANDGLASINQLATMTISPTKPVGTETSDGLIQTISSFIDSVFQAVLQDVDGANAVFYLKQAHMVSCYVSLPVILSSANASTEVPATGVPATPTPMPIPLPGPASTLSQPTVRETTANKVHSALAQKFLAQTFLLAALMCVKVYRFPKLLNPAFTKARELAGNDPTLVGHLAKAQPHLSAYSPHSVEVDCQVVGAALPYFGVGNGVQLKSALTTEPIVGSAVLLEDGVACIAQHEALQWSMCCAFSPLATGAHLLPF